jgi:hypothetical protein
VECRISLNGGFSTGFGPLYAAEKENKRKDQPGGKPDDYWYLV